MKKGAIRITRGFEVVTEVTGAFVHLTVEGSLSARKDLRSRLVACTEAGVRVGEDHGKSKLTNAQVDDMRDRHEAYPPGHVQHEGYRTLARAFNVSRTTAQDICTYRRRNAYPERWKRIDK